MFNMISSWAITAICAIFYSHFLVITLAAVNQTALVTFKNTCFSNSECPSGKFCNFDPEVSPFTSYCLPLRKLGATCTASSSTCTKGLECTFPFNASVARCRKIKSTVGNPCTVDGPGIRTCNGGERCAPSVPNSKKYVCTAGRGRNGDACEWDDNCDQDGGFYCKDQRVCRPKVQPGALCTNFDNYHCNGFCRTSPLKRSQQICIAEHQEGGKCKDEENCFNEINSVNPKGRMICNLQSLQLGEFIPGKLGICVREANLLKKLGTKCSPNMDKCDTRRGLSCRRLSQKKFVCKQVAFYCTPNNKFSTCDQTADGTPAVCAIPNPDLSSASFGSVRDERFYQCVRKESVVRRGQVCNQFAQTRCESGATCSWVSGIRGPPCFRYCDSLWYCRAPKKIGSKCESKFKDDCGDGNTCKNGKCVKIIKFNDYSHAGESVNCTTLPCAPGLICQGNGKQKTCGKPIVHVGRGKPCFPIIGVTRVSYQIYISIIPLVF